MYQKEQTNPDYWFGKSDAKWILEAVEHSETDDLMERRELLTGAPRQLLGTEFSTEAC